MAERALPGAIIAMLITALARRTGALDASGQWGAIGIGTIAAVAGWPWAFILVGYFIAASMVSRVGQAGKATRTESSVPPIHARTFAQVVANGGLFALLAFCAEANSTGTVGLAALGALAAASADTWSTEVGTLWGGTARSIVNGRPVSTGMSGGVTWLGSIGGMLGAMIVAGLAAVFHDLPVLGVATIAIAGGGITGGIADSVLGATLQSRRWCEHCKVWTERRVHPCNSHTVHAAGLQWMTNNMVNAAATLVGAVSTVVIARVLQ